MSGMKPTRTTSAMLSLHLSCILDAVGVSERAVNKRRQTILKKEKIENVNLALTGYNLTLYFFGSQSESSTTLGLDPDSDVLIHWNDAPAIQSICEWERGKLKCLVLQGGDIPAGYCRLQLLSQWSPILPPNAKFTHDDKGRALLKHNENMLPGYTRHGPARTDLGDESSCDIDFVIGFKCNSVSKQVEPWIKRMQNKQWPTRDMLKTATESGFFLVPVGHRPSETPFVEWRVSPSLTERCLMLGMNITQIQCYVMLKMIKKDLIIPKIRESITSFHLKNVLFHCVENKPTEFWSAKNLVACIDVCLKYLLSCVQKRSCPNFLIPEENLFSGRIKERQMHHLKKLLQDLIESKGLYLFQIECDQVGDVLTQCFNSPSTIDPGIFIIGEADVLGQWEKIQSECLQSMCERSLMYASVSQVQEQIVKLQTIQKSSDSVNKSVETSYLQILYSTYGSMIASRCIHEGKVLSQEALSYLEHGSGYDLMSGRLKKASALYSCGQYTDAASVLEELDSRYDFRCVQPVCECNFNLRKKLKPEFIQRVFCDNTNLHNSMLTAHHVAFTAHEFHCCPLALRFDMFRGIGNDRARRKPVLDYWMDMAVVDSVTFLYFLMYLTYGSMGNRQLQLHALNNLIRSLSTNKEHVFILHYETALNLLGQCFEMEGMSGDALLCYRLSLQRIRRNNSASWLVALLIYKHFSRPLLGLCWKTIALT